MFSCSGMFCYNKYIYVIVLGKINIYRYNLPLLCLLFQTDVITVNSSNFRLFWLHITQCSLPPNYNSFICLYLYVLTLISLYIYTFTTNNISTHYC